MAKTQIIITLSFDLFSTDDNFHIYSIYPTNFFYPFSLNMHLGKMLMLAFPRYIEIYCIIYFIGYKIAFT